VWQPNPDDGGLSQQTFGTGRWPSNGSNVAVTLASGLDPSTSHDVRVFKSTEAQWNELVDSPNFVALVELELRSGSGSVSGGGSGAAAQGLLGAPALLPRRPPEPPRPRDGSEVISAPRATSPRRVEFLGDSITAGFCNLCELNGNAFAGAEAEGAFEAWPARVAALLGDGRGAQGGNSAEVHTVAWSGYGLVHNCCGGETHMPAIYQRALSSVPTASVDYPPTTTGGGGESRMGDDGGHLDNAWDFGGWVPDAVVVNLGTNDVASGSYDETEFSSVYVELAANITRTYGSGVTLFLACGPMSEAYCGGVQLTLAALDALPVGDPGKPKAAHFLDQTLATLEATTGSSVTLGCCGHPTAGDDDAMAQYSAAAIAAAMGWD